MFVIGTAGHVDHGKSTLITRLTGIDPDRLAEEKARGLTIDLGYAWTTLPSGREIGIVDVPGHERFVHNMLAGAGQIDAVVFVVDANEGWRPQSEEHLAILDLLRPKGGVVALTKIDACGDVPAAVSDVATRLAGTVLDGAPIVPVSAASGDGIDALVSTLDDLLGTIGEPSDDGQPRVLVDRSFTIKGAGTVVTGTLTGGRLAEGDEIEILPSGVRARIRSLQTHRTTRAHALPTSRVALNLAGLDRHEIRRGDAIVAPGAWRPTTRVDVALRGVRSLSQPVTARGAYLLFAGTAETPARIRLLGTDRVEAGGEGFARITLAHPLVVREGDRVVLRDTGRGQTVAGGAVLDAHPPADLVGADRTARLRARKDALMSPEVLATLAVQERGIVLNADLSWLVTAPPRGVVTLASYTASREWMAAATERIESALAAFHAGRPLERGMAREELRREAAFGDGKMFDDVLRAMHPVVAEEGTLVRLASHRVILSPALDAAREKLLAELDEAGFSPPPASELAARYGAPLLTALTDAGELVAVTRELVYAAARIQDAKRLIAAAAAAEGGLTAARIKELLATSRKYAIPLLEWLDAQGFTRRDGDVRTIRSS